VRPLYRPAVVIMALAVPGAAAALALVVSLVMVPHSPQDVHAVFAPHADAALKKPNAEPTLTTTAHAPKEAP
jgi:hypothetical protein